MYYAPNLINFYITPMPQTANLKVNILVENKNDGVIAVEARRIGYSEADLLTSYPSLSATDIANAWVYAAAEPDEIETDIRENDEVMHEVL